MEILIIRNGKTTCNADISLKSLGRNLKQMCSEPGMKYAVTLPVLYGPLNYTPLVKNLAFITLFVGFGMETVRVILTSKEGKEFWMQYLKVIKRYGFTLLMIYLIPMFFEQINSLFNN